MKHGINIKWCSRIDCCSKASLLPILPFWCRGGNVQKKMILTENTPNHQERAVFQKHFFICGTCGTSRTYLTHFSYLCSLSFLPLFDSFFTCRNTVFFVCTISMCRHTQLILAVLHTSKALVQCAEKYCER